MVTRTTIARLQQRIETVVSRLDPEPLKPRHPGLATLREMAARFMVGVAPAEAAERAEAAIAEAAREGHEHLREHPEHPLYGRSVTEEEARATYAAARAKTEAVLQRFLEPKRGTRTEKG